MKRLLENLKRGRAQAQLANQRPRQRTLRLESLEGRRLMTAGPTFEIGSPFADRTEVATASSQNGMSVAAWTKHDSNGDTDIQAQVYRSDGSEVGAILSVANTNREEFAPSVAMDADGDFVVTWTREDSSGDQDVLARRFGADGDSLGGVLFVANSSTRKEYEPDVAMDASGRFIVSFTDEEPLFTTYRTWFGNFTIQTGTDLDVRARRFNANGGLMNTIAVSTSNSNSQDSSSVAATDDGRFTVAFRRSGDIWVRRFDSSASLIAGQRLDSTGSLAHPDIAMDASGNSVVAWQDNGDIKARRVSSGGALGTTRTIVSTDVNSHPSVALARDGNTYFVAYNQTISGGGLVARHVEVAHVTGATNQVQRTEDFGVGYQSADISVDGDGNYFVGYSDSFGPEVLGRWGVAGAAAPTFKLDHDFDIDVNFLGGMSPTQRALFQQAADRWEQVIRGDLSEQTFTDVAGIVWNVDDLRIDAQGVVIDGAGTDTDGDGVIDSNILGQAAPDSFRGGGLLPFHGFMQFDTADLNAMESNGTLLNVIMHEMGHVLGIGVLWDNMGLVTGLGTSNPRYTGTNAVNAYNAARGPLSTWFPATSVPVANTGGAGTAGSHWRESVLSTELMTGFVEPAGTAMPLSAITIGSLDDMGYSVRYDVADAFAAPLFEARLSFTSTNLTSTSSLSRMVAKPEDEANEPQGEDDLRARDLEFAAFAQEPSQATSPLSLADADNDSDGAGRRELRRRESIARQHRLAAIASPRLEGTDQLASKLAETIGGEQNREARDDSFDAFFAQLDIAGDKENLIAARF